MDDTQPNIMAIDRGTKHLGVAYRAGRGQVTMPVGNLENDGSVFFSLAGILERYQIDTVLIGYPKQHEMSKRAVDAFIENLLYVDPTLVVKKVDEEYSSVVADAKLEKYQKGPEEDTLAAMKILDWWIEQGAE